MRRAPRGDPRREIVPESGRSKPARHLATVVLPQPDSPTMPRVSPAATENETSSTAVTRGPLPDRERNVELVGRQQDLGRKGLGRKGLGR